MQLFNRPCLLGFIFFTLIAAGCGGPGPTTLPEPVISLNNMTRTPRPPREEVIDQDNCNGSAEVENQIERSLLVSHVIEVGGGFEVTGDGQIGISGTDVGLGTTVAGQLGYSYGTAENIIRSVTVKAQPGTHMRHTIGHSEVMDSGTALVIVGSQSYTIPFSFHSDFALEYLGSEQVICPNDLGDAINPEAEVEQAPTTSLDNSSETPPGPIDQSASRWRGEYFNNFDLSGTPVFVSEDTSVSFDWGIGRPTQNIGHDDFFSVRWTRCSEFQEGVYTFTIRADDNAEVWLDDSIPVVNVSSIGARTRQHQHFISTGQHCLKIEYREATGQALIIFDVTRNENISLADNSNKNVIWHAEYFNNMNFEGSPVYERDYAYVDFNWDITGRPLPSMEADNFSIRWSACLNFDQGTYIFKAKADDSIEVFVDDVRVLSATSATWRTLTEVEYDISQGEHCLEVRFVEQSTYASAFFDFEKK